MNNGKILENNFIKSLNNHNYNELNLNLQQFISFLFEDFQYNKKIYCKKLGTHEKADISIQNGNIIKYISLKTGSQNSVHVEKISTFIEFLSSNGINQQIINNLLIYHYGDDTLNGTGSIRYSAEESKRKYRQRIEIFNASINYSKILTKIVERFLFKGTRISNKYVDAIYYGDINIGIWCSSQELLEYCTNHKSMYMKVPHFSIFTYQNWCRNISFSKKSESHRAYMQIKWFSILSDINKIRMKDKIIFKHLT